MLVYVARKTRIIDDVLQRMKDLGEPPVTNNILNSFHQNALLLSKETT